MGRVKLQIKRIENITNSTYYVFSIWETHSLLWKQKAFLKSIEEIITRYVSLPDHERGRLHNREFLQRALCKLRSEGDPSNFQVASPGITDSELEEFQKEIVRFKSQVENMEKQLWVLEGNLSHITTLGEAEYQEHVLEDALKRIQMHKQFLEVKYNQVPVDPKTANVNDLVTEEIPNSILDCLRERDPQVQILNFLDSNCLLPLRNQVQRPAEILASSSSNVAHGQNMNVDDHISPRSGGLEDHNNVQMQNVNLSPWTEFYPIGNSSIHASSQPRERALLELYLSHITPPTI